MAIEISIPRLGWTMEEGTFVEWLKNEGDAVAVGDPLFAIETDKATQEVDAQDAGVLRIRPDGPTQGDTVKVGAVIGLLAAAGEEVSFAGLSWGGDTKAVAETETETETETDTGTGTVTGTATASQVRPASTGPTISPRAARLAIELGVDVRTLKGSGRTGRIRARDVLDAAPGSQTG